MLTYIIKYLIRPLLIAAPIYIGYNLYNGKYNDFLFGLMLQKVKYELYFTRKMENLLNYHQSDSEEEDEINECIIYYNGEKMLHSSIDEWIDECDKYPLKLYIKTINGKKNIYRLDTDSNCDKELDLKLELKSVLSKKFENKLDSPFLQVELNQGGEKILLDNGLSDFYFNGNKILDKIFLKWFLDYYNYDINLQEEYIVKIMDNNINFHKLSDGHYVILNKDGFIKNEEQTEEQNEEQKEEETQQVIKEENEEENEKKFEYETDI